MKSKSAEKVRLTSFDDLFGANEAAAGETVTSVPLSQLHKAVWRVGAGDCAAASGKRL